VGVQIRAWYSGLWLLVAVLAWSLRSHAQTPEPAWLSPRINADPNGSAYGFEYRGAVRGRFSDTFDLYGGGEQPGYGIALTPLFELHEPRHSENVLPSQYWRARVTLEQGYTWVKASRRVRLTALLMHESDHETAHAYSKPGFLALNDVAVRVLYGQRHAGFAWNVALDAEVYVVSCTKARSVCENFRGDSSFGGQLSGALGVARLRFWRFVPFAAASATGILPNGLVAAERRLLGRLGAYAQFGDSSLALFALGSLGNDVGIVRLRTLNVVGAGLSFAR
jgi:hypothetical protein